MTSVAAAERRVLPRGWFDLFKQVLIWFAFVLCVALTAAALPAFRASRMDPMRILRED